MKVLVILLMSFVFLIGAEENSFDVSPAPVSQIPSADGETNTRMKATSISASYDDFDISGFGLQLGKQDGEKDGAINKSGSIITLSGTGDGLDASLIAVNAALLWEKYNQTPDGAPYTLFYGLDISYMYMNAYNDNFEIDVYTLMYGGVGGVQYNIHTTDMIFSPFALAKYLMGSYEAEVWAGGYAYTEGDIEPILSTSFGFDIYFKSLNSTLSAMIKSDENSDSTMLSYTWYW